MQPLNELVEQLTSRDNSEAYASCELLRKAAATDPEVAAFIDAFTDMLDAPSSYARTRGFLLLVACARWDSDGRIETAFDRMAACLHDPKPTVVRQCIKALPGLVLSQPHLAARVVTELEAIDPGAYRESMQPLIAADVTEALKALQTCS